MSKVYNFLVKVGSHLELPNGRLYVQAGHALSIKDPVVAKGIIEKSISGSQFIDLISTEDLTEESSELKVFVEEPVDPKTLQTQQCSIDPPGILDVDSDTEGEGLILKNKQKK